MVAKDKRKVEAIATAIKLAQESLTHGSPTL
jgi:hypothetical protein